MTRQWRVYLAPVISVALAGCAPANLDSPTVVPAARVASSIPRGKTSPPATARTTLTSTARSTTTATIDWEPDPVTSGASTLPLPNRVLGSPLPDPVNETGRDVTGDDLATLVDGNDLAAVAGNGPIAVSFFTSELDRRFATPDVDQKALVDTATAAGGLAMLAVTVRPGGSERRGVTIRFDLFATSSGARKYARKTSTYLADSRTVFNGSRAIFQEIPIPEIPGAVSHRVLELSQTFPTTTISAARGPVAISVVVTDQVNFTTQAIEDAISLARTAFKRIDDVCGSSCGGAAGIFVTPIATDVTDLACFDPVPNATTERVVVPTTRLLSMPCDGPHSGEVVQMIPSPNVKYPSSLAFATEVETYVEGLCKKAVLGRTPNPADEVISSVLPPTAAQFLAGENAYLCVVTKFGPPFRTKYLP
jgi:hypothetical protein